MTYADAEQRRNLIAGLRSLADFLEENPGVPAPRWANVMVFPTGTSEREAFEEVDAIAALASGRIDNRTTNHGNYTAARDFGPVQYRAVVIPASSRAYHEAQASYAKNVVVSEKGCDR